MILYKYYPDNVFSYRSLSLRGLWCHYPKNMNDPFECLGYSERIISKEQVELFRNSIDIKNKELKIKIDNFTDELVRKFINEQRKYCINQYTFCSLSKKNDSIKMWSHYASEHKGFVIEFEFDDSTIDYHFQKVNYVTTLPEFDVTKLAKQLNGDSQLDYLLSDISVKTIDWQEENEYRIWRIKPTYYHFKLENIKKVIFGLHCPIETKALVLNIFNEYGEKIEYFEMEFKDSPIRLEMK